MATEQDFERLKAERQAERARNLTNYLAKRGQLNPIVSSPAPKLKEDWESHGPIEVTPRNSWLEEHPLDLSQNEGR